VEFDVEIQVEFIEIPKEQEEAWETAIRILAEWAFEMMNEEFGFRKIQERKPTGRRQACALKIIERDGRSRSG